MSEIVLVKTGVANVASIVQAFARLGHTVRPSDDPGTVATADRVVLPGVGSFEAGMSALREHRLDDALCERHERERPLLAICLGLQLLFSSSEESAGTPGLGWFSGLVNRLPETVRVPHMGWNELGAGAVPPGFAYFANSFAVAAAPAGCEVSWVDHGGPFIGALSCRSLLACQFHPELSGDYGRALLARWSTSC